MLNPLKWRRAFRRILDALHEIGLLLVALAPLDYALDERPLKTTWPYMIVFVTVGVVLIALCIVGEWRLPDD